MSYARRHSTNVCPGNRVRYSEPWALWRELLPEYRGRVSAATRRAGDLSLGEYRLDEFNEFYAALVTICAAHDFLCFQWGRHCGTYPMESAVMVRPAAGWAEVLSELSGVGCESCHVMLSDLTFSVTRSVDLHVYPLVPLDEENETLALAPPFPLHGRHDENILRVCSQRRPLVYDVTSRAKGPAGRPVGDACARTPRVPSPSRLRRTFGPQGPTLGDLSDAYLQDYLVRQFRSHSTARGRTAHLAAFFGRDARATALTTYQIRQYQLARRAAG